MKNNIRNILVGAAAVLALAACGDDKPKPRSVPTVPQPAIPQTADMAADAETEPTEQTTEFTYDLSLRDPFQQATGVAVQATTDCGPLCQYDVGQYRIIGIVWGIAQPVAMLRSPDGKPHIAKVGSPIGKNNGKIVSISKDRLVVLEKYVNYRGEVVTNRVDVELPTEEGARR